MNDGNLLRPNELRILIALQTGAKNFAAVVNCLISWGSVDSPALKMQVLLPQPSTPFSNKH